MKKINLVIFFSLIQAICLGQTEMFNSQYLLDKTFVTPANFDQEDKLKVYMNFQNASGKERSGKENMYSASANYRLPNGKNYLGANLVRSKFGFENSTLAYVNYTHNITVNENAILSNGIGFGVQQYRLGLSDAIGVNPNDPAYKGDIYSSKFDMRLGITALLNKRSFFGVAFDNILSKYNNQNSIEDQYLPANFRRINMILMAGSKSQIASDLTLSYEGFYNYSFGGTTSLDANAKIIVGEVLAVGLAYRKWLTAPDGATTSPAVLRPFIQFDVKKSQNKLKVNYAYGFSAKKSNAVAFNTHDIGLAYILK